MLSGPICELIMAKEERPREDLMRDAVAYKRRAEYCIADSEPVFFGLRDNGGVSFYFGEDPVLHFNSKGELRRAYFQNDLYKAEDGRLVRMTRERSAGASTLVSKMLTADAQSMFLSCHRDDLHNFAMTVGTPGVKADRVVPADFDAGKAIYDYVTSLPNPLRVADSPHAS